MPWLWLLMACVLLEVKGEGEEKKKKNTVGKPRKYESEKKNDSYKEIIKKY